MEEPEREAFDLLRLLAVHEWIQCHDWQVHPPKWTPNEEGDCYTFERYDQLGRVAATALSDWVRRPMSDRELTFAAHERFGHDLLVTTDRDLLQLSASTDNANILRPSLALPLVHLYLRSRGTFIYDAGDSRSEHIQSWPVLLGAAPFPAAGALAFHEGSREPGQGCEFAECGDPDEVYPRTPSSG